MAAPVSCLMMDLQVAVGPVLVIPRSLAFETISRRSVFLRDAKNAKAAGRTPADFFEFGRDNHPSSPSDTR